MKTEKAIFEAAMRGRLPAKFPHWGLRDRQGRTVAHVAAENGNLPKDFDQWELRDRRGRTVAQVAAEYSSFDWDWV